MPTQNGYPVTDYLAILNGANELGYPIWLSTHVSGADHDFLLGNDDELRQRISEIIAHNSNVRVRLSKAQV